MLFGRDPQRVTVTRERSAGNVSDFVPLTNMTPSLLTKSYTVRPVPLGRAGLRDHNWFFCLHSSYPDIKSAR